MAKFTQIEIIAIELIPILSERSTINGAKNAPYKLKASINPAAVDWISTVNAYVCMQAIKVYEIAILTRKNYLRKFSTTLKEQFR